MESYKIIRCHDRADVENAEGECRMRGAEVIAQKDRITYLT